MSSSIVELNSLLDSLKQGDLSALSREVILLINKETTRILSIKEEHSHQDIIKMGMIIMISNILYNNTSIDILPLDDGLYDLLLELYKKYNPDYQIGAPPIVFKDSEAYNNIKESKKPVPGIIYYRPEETKDFLFIEELDKTPPVSKNDFIKNGIIYDTVARNTTRDTSHKYPELVGTLNKAKFVLVEQALEKGVLDDTNVSVLERDFFAKHLKNGIIRPNQEFGMVLELKYDGISIEAEVSNRIISARTRGDTNEDLGADVTHILKNYRFPNAIHINPNDIFGMKFEACISHENLLRYNKAKGKDYKNCRTAISSIFSSLDGEDFSDYITLIPLATSIHDIDRLTEIAFMNTYYTKGEYLRYAVIYGDYIRNLFQIKKFTEEAEYMRSILPFMYDGIVVSYLDDHIKEKLGRYNSVNLYSIAVKFNALKKQTVFRGYSYTVGQDGCITPMIHYDPVEFYGTIHDKSSGHSYDRFKQLNLAIDDIINLEYVNDVMVYVSKEEESQNNPNPPVEFIDKCPSCGEPLEVSKSGKAIFCRNMNCPGRNISRMVGMLKKLNLKDFAEESLVKIARFSFKELMELTVDDISFLGDINSRKFINQLNELKVNPIYDYKILGSLGFTGLALEKWKLILSKHTLQELVDMSSEDLRLFLTQIKGIGSSAVDTIISEMNFYKEDLEYILSMNNVMSSKNAGFNGKIIRFTGFRDKELSKKLYDLGHDANTDGNVTKSTDILLIPYAGFSSSKTNKCGEHTLIIPVEDFKNNMDKYLSK